MPAFELPTAHLLSPGKTNCSSAVCDVQLLLADNQETEPRARIQKLNARLQNALAEIVTGCRYFVKSSGLFPRAVAKSLPQSLNEMKSGIDLPARFRFPALSGYSATILATR